MITRTQRFLSGLQPKHTLGTLVAASTIVLAGCDTLTQPEDCTYCEASETMQYQLAVPVERETLAAYTPCIPGRSVDKANSENDFWIEFIDHTGENAELNIRNADWCGAVHPGAAGPLANHVGYSWTGQLATNANPHGPVHGELVHVLELWPSNNGSVVTGKPNTMPGWDLTFLPSGIHPASSETVVGRAAQCQYELVLHDNVTETTYSSCQSGFHHIPTTNAHTTTPFTEWSVLDEPRIESFETFTQLQARVRELYRSN